MPFSAETERRLLNRYKLTTLYPDAWPDRHGVSDESEDDDNDGEAAGTNGHGPSRNGSKLSHASRSSLTRYPGRMSDSLKDSNPMAQKDEPDPLGAKPSVSVELKRRGVPIDEDLKLHDRFMMSSTTFSPALFLSQVHHDDSVEDLLRGLEFLTTSIEKKSASLKVLVESNFERFVKAKATIDNVYAEMRMNSTAEGTPRPQSHGFAAASSKRPHSRQVSKNQTHFRSASNSMFSGAKMSPNLDKKKNALTKESEYGVQGIKLPLIELALRAEEVWGPVLGGREKEEALRGVMATIEQHRDVFRLNGDMADAIRKNDYDTVVELFRKARQHAAAARAIADRAKGASVPLDEQGAQQIIITAKMWHDVNDQITTFKRNVRRKLKTSHGRKPVAVGDGTDKEEHMDIMAVLIQLGIDTEDNNPIWEWLHSRYLYLKDKIAQSFEKSRIEIEIMRRKLANNAEKADPNALAKHLQFVAATQTPMGRLNIHASRTDMDEPSVMAFWEKVTGSLTALLSRQNGILSEVVEYWDTTTAFIDNTGQKAFPIAVFATGSDQLELEPDDVANLRSGVIELVDLIRESIMAFFVEAPVEDLGQLYSPILPTPTTPDAGSALSPNGVKRRFSFDPTNVPPPSPLKGASWEKFAFWAPQANSLSGSHYLAQAVALVGAACAELASMTVVKQTRGAESLKSVVGAVRERCIQALCAAWHTDAERCKVLESWTRSPGRRDLTTFPASLSAFMERVMGDAQKIAYISDAVPVRGSAEVIVPPPTKLLQALRSTFVTSVYKVLSGMVENAEEIKIEKLRGSDPDGVTRPNVDAAAADGATIPVNANNRNIRILLTLSNLGHLRAEVIPHLISQFETAFSVKLTDETKSIHDVLSHIDSQLFQSYVHPTTDKLDRIIKTGITDPTWLPQGPSARPNEAKPYVYDMLLTLVLVHSEVSSTTPGLTTAVLGYDLEMASRSLMSAFQHHTRYSLPALMQATLDVEFLAQTLNAYTSDRAGEVQSQIYLALDERTDNDARARLQAELPEMRAVLKRLREATKGEFGCFRRERKARGEKPGTSGAKAI